MFTLPPMSAWTNRLPVSMNLRSTSMPYFAQLPDSLTTHHVAEAAETELYTNVSLSIEPTGLAAEAQATSAKSPTASMIRQVDNEAVRIANSCPALNGDPAGRTPS